MSARRPLDGARARQHGAAAIEFQIIAFMVLIPLLMAVLQMGLMMLAKNTVNVAALGAARAGAASGVDKDAMTHALALGLTPLHASAGKELAGVGMGDISAGNYLPVMSAAYAKSRFLTGWWGKITVLNPTGKSFADFGVNKTLGRVIPVTNVMDNNTIGAQSRQTRADALLLKIEVRYCHDMAVPIINDMISQVMILLPGTSGPDRLCFAAKRVPIVSHAVVRMTTPPVQSPVIR